MGVFYKKRGKGLTIDDINNQAIELANRVLIKAGEVQGIADIISVFAPGGAVKASLKTILRRITKREFGRLGAPPSFEEKLGDFGAAAIVGGKIPLDTRLLAMEYFNSLPKDDGG